MKILFYFFRLDQSSGGAERMLCRLLSEMNRRGYEAQVVTWDGPRAQAFYPLPSGIVWHRLGFAKGLRDKLRRTRALRNVFRREQPDLFVGFVMGADKSVYAATLGTGVPVIAAERNAPSMYDYRISRARRWFYFNLFRFCRKVTVQLDSYRLGYPTYLRGRIVAIPNPVDPIEWRAEAGRQREAGHTLISVGRLEDQKRFDVLIGTFAILAKRFPDWRLRIVGEGEERRDLMEQVATLDLGGRVAFPGVTDDVTAEYLQADLFVTSAQWEGFPNALAEAMAHGLPAVGFAGCPGVNEMIQHGRNGLLAPGNADKETLADALAVLMEDADRRSSLGQVAARTIGDYDPERIFDRWEELFQEVGGESGGAR